MDAKSRISSLIGEWLQAEEGRTPHQLSRMSGVSHPTVRRLMLGQVQPQLSTIVPLLQILVKSQDECRDFLETYYPDSPVIFEAHTSAPRTCLTKEDLILMTLARRQSGCTLAQAKDRMGSAANRTVERLQKLGHITGTSNLFFASKNPGVGLPEEDLRNMSLAVQCMDDQRLREPGNRYEFLNAGLNDVGIERADRVMQIYGKLLRHICANPNYLGDRALISVLAMGRVD